MTKSRKIVIGTRGSKLAIWQAKWVKTELERLHPGLEVALNLIKTTGDKILDVPLSKVGGKGLFVKEIEESMLNGESHLAVHSMKDVPTELPEGLHISVICKREDPRDAFVARQEAGGSLRPKGSRKSDAKRPGFSDLEHGAVIGTSSLRRSCQLLNLRPDLKIEQLRGNLDTRLRKLDEGQFDAIILASAGLKRLGMADRITEMLSPALSLPAIAQGAIGIECRIDSDINELIAPLNDPETSVCVRAERAFLKKLEGGCQVPIAAHARLFRGTEGQESEDQLSDSNLQSEILIMDGLVGNLAGDTLIREHIEGNPSDAESLGIELAERLLNRGAKKILDEVYKQGEPLTDGNVAS
jgi:hydroxymethylbilane synthase